MKKPLVSKILKSLEREVGVKIILEPEFHFAGQIILPNGQYRYFRDTQIDINTLGASAIAKDKDYAAFFMKRMGFPVVQSFKFYSKKWCEIINSKINTDAAYREAKKIGFPVIVKPNDGSQGEGVCKVYNRREFYRACSFIFKKHNIALLQPAIKGRDYRIVVLDNKIISAYERIPLSIYGDGKSSIRKLIEIKQTKFKNNDRATKIDPNDYRIMMNLKRNSLTLDSLLKQDKQLYLLDNANLSTGGDATDVSDIIGQGFKKIALDLAKKMNLRYAGVDLMTIEKIEALKPKNYVILEINSAPGLDNYAYLGTRQEKLVRNLYKKVLEALKKE